MSRAIAELPGLVCRGGTLIAGYNLDVIRSFNTSTAANEPPRRREAHEGQASARYVGRHPRRGTDLLGSGGGVFSKPAGQAERPSYMSVPTR
jgi:hypothetical protein